MNAPALHHLQQDAHDNLEIADAILEEIQHAYPHAAALPHHQRLTQLLQRAANLLDHPILLIIHTIVYLRRAARYSRAWATLLKNTPTLENLLIIKKIPLFVFACAP